MKPKTLVLLCVAVGCGLVAMIGVQQAMDTPAVAKVEMTQVLEALSDIDPGVTLSDENVALKNIAKAAAPDDAVTSLEEYQKRSLTVAVVKGEYILKSKLSEPGVSGKSTQIPPGKTVVTINVDETQTHSNMMKAGDFVDVSVTYDARMPSGVQTKTMTLLERVVVFAIADQTKNDMVRRTDNTSIKARQVSLIVDFDEANSLVLAERKGQLRLYWRNPTDMQIHNSKAITEGLLTELRGLDMPSSTPLSRTEEPRIVTVVEPVATEPVVTEPVAVEQPVEQPKPDVHQFLAQTNPVEQTPEPVVADDPTPVPEKPMWEVKVYVGNDVQSYPFELTESPAEAVSSKESERTQAAGSLLQKFGWALPWQSREQAVDGKAAKTKQAL